MLYNRQHIAARVQVLEARRRLENTEPLDSMEFRAAMSALKLTGIKDCAERIMADSARFQLDELLQDLD